MRYDKTLIQCFAVMGYIASAACVIQENAFGAVVFILVATALVFIARNIGHLMKAFRYQRKMLRMMHELVVEIRIKTASDHRLFMLLSEIIDNLEHIENQMHNRE